MNVIRPLNGNVCTMQVREINLAYSDIDPPAMASMISPHSDRLNMSYPRDRIPERPRFVHMQAHVRECHPWADIIVIGTWNRQLLTRTKSNLIIL